MDIRIEKTKTAIHNTFLELRSRKPLEKITIKELCEKAQINKSTFYSHYKDIYDLRSVRDRSCHLRHRSHSESGELPGRSGGPGKKSVSRLSLT